MTLQYRTIRDHAAWADVTSRGRLRFEGRDAASFLHALVTNDVEGLASGRGAYAAWLTPQGRMITDLRLLRDDEGVFAEVPEGLAPALQARFDQLVFSEDVRVTDITASTRAYLVVGGRAPEVVAEATGADAAQVAALPVLGHLTSGDHRIIRTDDTDLPTFEIWTPKKASGAFFAERVSGRVSETTAAETLPETLSAPDAFFDALRIEAGHPKFGVDMTTDTIPLEAGLLERAISQSKGCYVGQEVIVRILHRGGGKVVKHLMRLAFDPAVSAIPAAGTVLTRDGSEVGAITSAAASLDTGHVIALGYVHRDSAVAGTVLTTPAGPARVVAFAG